jgi:hypothetical protein
MAMPLSSIFHRTPKKKNGNDFLRLVGTGSLDEIKAELALGADPNQLIIETWMDRVKPLGKAIDRGDLAIVETLRAAGGVMDEDHWIEVIRDHPDWIASLLPIQDPVNDLFMKAAGHDFIDGLGTVDSLAEHWSRPVRQAFLDTYPDKLPQLLAAKRADRGMEQPLPDVNNKPFRARSRP